MPHSRPTVFGGFGSAAVGSAVAVRRCRLTVRLRNEGEPPHLEVRSRRDPRQSFLVPLRHRPVLEGLSLHTRIGRVHAACWGLAFGAGELPSAAAVRFRSDTLRFRTAAEGRVPRLDGPYWVADAEGAVGAAALLVGDREVRTGPLADHW